MNIQTGPVILDPMVFPLSLELRERVQDGEFVFLRSHRCISRKMRVWSKRVELRKDSTWFDLTFLSISNLLRVYNSSKFSSMFNNPPLATPLGLCERAYWVKGKSPDSIRGLHQKPCRVEVPRRSARVSRRLSPV